MEDNQAQSLTPNVSSFERGLSIGLGALLVYSSVKTFRKAPVKAVVRSIVGSGLIVRGAAGYCPLYSAMHVDGAKRGSVYIQTTFVVNRVRPEVYKAWRNLGTLPRFMKHLANVEETGATTSRWELKTPRRVPFSVKWDAEIVKDEPGSLLSWRSLKGAPLENAGKVEFRDALGHRGTEVKVTIIYRPPAGNIGTGVAKLLNPLFKKLVKEDITGFKNYIEMIAPLEPSGGFR